PRGVVGKHYQQTFHPGVIDQSRAARVKVVAGRESTSVDIKVGQPEETYLISGRVIDAVSGNPIPDVPIRFVGYLGDSSRHGGVQSGPQGEFKVEHCPPGRYALEIGPYGGINKGYFSDPVVFEVADGDVTGVEIKGYRGASISGIAVIESATDPTLLAKLTNRIVSAFWTPGEGRRPDVPGSAGRDQASTQIGPDGRFEITGLRQVRVRITAGSLPEGFMFLRAERNGVPIKDGIDLNPGEAITDLRLVFAYGTGSIRGRARAEGGTLPERMLWIITARRADGEQVFFDMIESRGYFRIKGLAPGEYEVEAIADYTPIPGVTPSPHPGPVRQKVSVVNGVETEVNLILDLSRTGKE
ncbi:MAG TPA: carboxypeptidase-like regulatory domain-containing protein, partial [Blastocatellia bacterium]|nr:carboxypeptidase-like regulatory domain-containing protein [Blastocatellia bacterium]